MTTIIDGSAGITFPNGSNAQAAPSKVLQVVQGTTTTTVSTASSTYVDTTLTATITPLFSTSKILVIVHQNGLRKTVADLNNSMGLKILRNSTTICPISVDSFYTGTPLGLEGQTLSSCYLDSPATTSATTYKTQFCNTSGTTNVVVQTTGSGGSISSITLMEIAQ
jgi:hypothetical protein